MSRRAVFLDRDGTIVDDPGYPRDPACVRLLPGAAGAIARLNRAGLRTIVVTNQSGIARGLLSEEDYRAVETRVDELLAREGARLDAHYFCPHLPEITGPCECRKPGVALYRRAADRFGIALGESWWVGDRLRDILPARTLGGGGVLVLTGAGEAERAEAARLGFAVVPDLARAVDTILG
ncbi:MAG TPA: HAD family hydrolase [Gemmatimonadales bacterium]|nr:HAD family hydrolase [Gemmatimonadales bacterium]